MPAEKRSGVPSVEPIFITLDPYRDSCAQVGAYVKDFHPRMIGLTGTPGQVAKVAKAFRVYFAEVDRKEDDEDYLGTCPILQLHLPAATVRWECCYALGALQIERL